MQSSSARESGSKSPAPSEARTAAGSRAASAKSELRGLPHAEQEAALAPPPSWAPGPRQFTAPRGGNWIAVISGKHSAFDQRLRIEGAEADLPSDGAPPVGASVDVKANGPWTLSIDHRVPEQHASWAKGKPVGEWLPSALAPCVKDENAFDVGSEDFTDRDFNDLVVSCARDDSPEETPSGEDEGDGAYLVSSETQVKNAVTTYDLILGASSSGRLDVVLDHVVLFMEDLGTVDREALAAMAARLPTFRSQIQSSAELRVHGEVLIEKVSAWERAVQAALARPAAADQGRASPSAAATKPAKKAKTTR